jgi:hypothetical protein
MHRGNEYAIIVEGEKCTDAAHNQIGERYDVTSWSNGTNSVHKVDWSPLYQRKVILWADNDLKTYRTGDKKGELKPIDEQSGRTAMMWIKDHLSAHGSECYLLDQPDNKPDGWDCADAVEDGFDLEQYIKDHWPPAVTEDDEDPHDDSMIVRPLGYDGNTFYYYSQLNKQLTSLHFREHTENAMFSLADKTFWQSKFGEPGKDKWDKSEAASWMMSACRT